MWSDELRRVANTIIARDPSRQFRVSHQPQSQLDDEKRSIPDSIMSMWVRSVEFQLIWLEVCVSQTCPNVFDKVSTSVHHTYALINFCSLQGCCARDCIPSCASSLSFALRRNHSLPVLSLALCGIAGKRVALDLICVRIKITPRTRCRTVTTSRSGYYGERKALRIALQYAWSGAYSPAHLLRLTVSSFMAPSRSQP